MFATSINFYAQYTNQIDLVRSSTTFRDKGNSVVFEEANADLYSYKNYWDGINPAVVVVSYTSQNPCPITFTFILR
jgi:hypothetical protein